MIPFCILRSRLKNTHLLCQGKYHCLCSPMEFFSRRRWRLASALLSIKFGYCPLCNVSIVLYFINTKVYFCTEASLHLLLAVTLHGLPPVCLLCIHLLCLCLTNNIFTCLVETKQDLRGGQPYIDTSLAKYYRFFVNTQRSVHLC